ncbi:hypothetical protein J437_LFUL011040 [Ladona fulva]|uniref:Uncharacterized protein n=1 Tax=Ladona fulva TaxID=123851 RepID=A0A8K0KF85_LADFU|nr:hypothetical protein J437_LFUL011040 [Ladona fulva]
MAVKGKKAEVDEVAKLVEDSLSPKVLKAIPEEVRRSILVEPKKEHLKTRSRNIEVVGPVDALEKRLDALEKRLDALEQYSHRNCLLLHGLQENHNENAVSLFHFSKI